jgi:glutamate racemase
LDLNSGRPQVLDWEENTKGNKKRAVPLHPRLAAELSRIKPANAKETDFVFLGCFPHYETLRHDLEPAGIAHRDAMGRVVHFHAFRKTWQTLGVQYGINQRTGFCIMTTEGRPDNFHTLPSRMLKGRSFYRRISGGVYRPTDLELRPRERGGILFFAAMNA